MDKKTEMLRKTVKIKGSAKKWKKDRRSAKKLPNLEYIYHRKAHRVTNPMNLCVTLTKDSKEKCEILVT